MGSRYSFSQMGQFTMHGSVGCSACAAVLFPLSSDEDHITCVEPVGRNVSAVICEIYGIILALKLAVNYDSATKVKKAAQSLFVLCDSSVAIDMIIQRSGSVNTPDVLELLQLQAKELAEMNVCMYLAWILGHAGIEGNERAAKLANGMAEDIFKGRVSASSHISMNSALQISAEITNNSWQRKWERDRSSFSTHVS